MAMFAPLGDIMDAVLHLLALHLLKQLRGVTKELFLDALQIVTHLLGMEQGQIHQVMPQASATLLQDQFIRYMGSLLDAIILPKAVLHFDSLPLVTITLPKD
jgi:hypothetical protein